MNNIVLIGNVGKNVEKFGPCVKTSLAVRRDFKNNEGVYETDWINIIGFNKTGELMEKLISKGNKIAVSGKIRTGSYMADSKKVPTFDVVVDKFYRLDSNKEAKEAKEEKEKVESAAQFVNQATIEDDDLPF